MGAKLPQRVSDARQTCGLRLTGHAADLATDAMACA